jgi:hypothetical protein
MDENPYRAPQAEGLALTKRRKAKRGERGLWLELVVLQVVLLVLGLLLAGFLF